MRPEPMTAETAREIVAEMVTKTSRLARRQMLALAIDRGNLSDGARAVYLAQLRKENQS